jgi:hypothetical protein
MNVQRLRKFVMTKEQEARVQGATTAPVPGLHEPGSWAHNEIVQRRVNAVWAQLGRQMGFNPYTVQPAPESRVLNLVGRLFGVGVERRAFLAEPTEGALDSQTINYSDIVRTRQR